MREGIGVVQMVIFKELRALFAEKYPERDVTNRSMLVGATINMLFDVENPEERFRNFKHDNAAVIEQELLGFAGQFPQLLPHITDALRILVLCDHQEGEDSTIVLHQAEELGMLMTDREVPLPSTFMTSIRVLGEEHGLTVAPMHITPEEDRLMH